MTAESESRVYKNGPTSFQVAGRPDVHLQFFPIADDSANAPLNQGESHCCLKSPVLPPVDSQSL